MASHSAQQLWFDDGADLAFQHQAISTDEFECVGGFVHTDQPVMDKIER
jgi:hypothetical protein